METTNTENARRTDTEDARRMANAALAQIKTSLLAALGAGELAGEAVTEAFTKAKTRVNESSEIARRNIEGLPSDMESLRERMDPAELRRLLDEYTNAALNLYHRLAETGEQTWERLVAQPPVKRGIEQLEEAVQTAQELMGDVATDTRDRVDDVVARVTGRTREAGVQAGRAAEEVADKVADKIEDVAPDTPGSRPTTEERKPAGRNTTKRANTTNKSTGGSSKTPK